MCINVLVSKLICVFVIAKERGNNFGGAPTA